MKKKITQGVITRLQPEAKDFIVWDTDLKGFGVKVTPKGQKTYFIYYRTFSGQQRRPSIGKHGKLTADEARKIARQWLADATGGGDVSGERQKIRKALTIKELTDLYLKDHAEPHKKPSSVKTDRANINNHILPLLGTAKVQDVRQVDIVKLKAAISRGKTSRKLTAKPRGRRIVKGGEGVANRVLALLSKMFSCAIAWEIRKDNPVRGIQRFKETPKDRFLNEDEVKRLHNALDVVEREESVQKYAIAAIRFLLFTGLRHGEVAGLRWREVDEKDGCLCLEDTKTGGRKVPLGTAALTILASFDRGEPDELVFMSSKPGARISLRRPWYYIRERAELGADVTIHTLRHTFGSWAVMGGLSLPETGAMLGHRSVQTTLRYAHHDQKAIRRNAERVSSTINAIGKGQEAEILPLPNNGL